jgi:hypothetical protein
VAARTVVCPECSETLPYGRLSCPACGSLLASVTGGTARAAARSAAPPAPVTESAGPQPAADEAGTPRPKRRWRAKQGSPAGDDPQVTVAAAATPGTRQAAPRPAPLAARVPALAPSKVGAVTLAARLEGTTFRGAAPTPPVLGDWPAGTEPALGGPSPWRRDGVQRPRDMDWDNAVDGPRAGAHGPGGNGNGAHAAARHLPAWAGGPRHSTGTVDWPAASAPPSGSAPTPAPAPGNPAKPNAPPPGAYLPPSGTFTARDSGLARGKLVQPGSAHVAAAPVVREGIATVSPNLPPGETDTQPGPGSAPLLADLPFDAPNSLPGWLIAAGSAAAIAGFLLPWSTTIPFASGFGYLDTWGLATPSHLLLLLATVATLALAILPNRVAAWLRTGVAGLVLGALLLGIVWPYLLDGFGAMIGALAEGVAAALLLIGGLLAVRPPRHAEDEPAV